MDLGLSQFDKPVFQRVGDNIYATTYDTRVFKLTHAPYTEEAKDCLFNWAEEQYPSVFNPAFANSEVLDDYIYRYYSGTDTYLGFFRYYSAPLKNHKTPHRIKTWKNSLIYQN
jgi:hypothetical protein